MTLRNALTLTIFILGLLSGIAAIVLLTLDYSKIGGILILGIIPAAIALIEWRCREQPRSRLTPSPLNSVTGASKTTGPELSRHEELPVPLEVRINIAPDSVRGK